MSGSQYAKLVPKIHRTSRNLPKIDRPMRPRMVAWAGPAAFYPNRFYEIDKWYKARIDKPEKIPHMHIIDPTSHMSSLNEVVSIEEKEEINVGFAPRVVQVKTARSAEERSALEVKSRRMELFLDMNTIKEENVRTLGHHFNIFSDLFGKGVYFDSVQDVSICYGEHGVHLGNTILTSDLDVSPEVTLESFSQKAFTSLFMISLDGNPYQKSGEILHWAVTNIPDGQPLSGGHEAVTYLQPLPFFGTGFHRVAFVTFRHQSPIDFAIANAATENSTPLEQRIFSMQQFYKTNEDVITPSAVRFFQCTYDDSVKRQLHSLGMKSPLYEYEFTEALKPKQREFPEKSQPFDLYLDMYRNPKEFEAEMLEERLKKAQLNDLMEPKWLDTNYVENKKTLPAWQHRRLFERNPRRQATYSNAVQNE